MAGQLASINKMYYRRIIKTISGGRQAKVSSVIHNGRWNCPEGRRQNAEVKKVMEGIPGNRVPRTQQADRLQWVTNNCGPFTVASAVKTLRCRMG